MSKELAKTELDYLAEEIKGIVTHAREAATLEMITMKHAIGKEISESAVYKKYSKDQGDLLEQLSELTGIRKDGLYDCVKFYEAYPKGKSKEIADKVYTKLGTWRAIRGSLYGEVSDVSETTERSKCKHCPIHCK